MEQGAPTRYSESIDQSTWNNTVSAQLIATVPKVSQESLSYKMHSPNTEIELQRSEKSGFLLAVTKFSGSNQKNDGEHVWERYMCQQSPSE